MARRRSLIALVVTGLVATVTAGVVASAEGDTRCTGTLGAVTVPGDLVVPPGRTCRLLGTAVDGETRVERDATLLARSAVLVGGLDAGGFRRVDLLRGRVEGRGPNWVHAADDARAKHFVLHDGGEVTITDGDSRGDYSVVGNSGRVVVRGIFFDTGSLTCRDNAHRPVVRGISAETPGVLKGQCAGLRNFGITDF